MLYKAMLFFYILSVSYSFEMNFFNYHSYYSYQCDKFM